jgi:tetratricopeptide (TPR) repeat protein
MPRTDRSVLVAGLALFGLASFAPVPARAQDGDPDELLRADRAAALKRVAAQLFAQARYRDALAQYQAAYGVRQEAELLLHMARTHQRLGDPHTACAFYVKYLTAAPAGPPELRSEAEQAIDRMEKLSPPLTQPFGALAAGPLTVKRSPYNVGMLVAGVTIFSISHSLSSVTGAICIPAVGQSRSVPQAACWTMFIPGVGPFISGGLLEDPAVGALVALLAGGFQVIGIGLWGGAYRHPQTRVIAPEPQAQLAPWRGPETSGLAVGVRF